MNQRLNTEVSCFESDVEGEYAIHFPLLGKALKADKHAVDIIENLKSGRPLSEADKQSQAYKKLLEWELIGDGIFDVPRIEEITDFKPIEGTLIFTETCNLGCTYCYASSAPVKSQTLSPETAYTAVDVILENARQTPEKFASFRYIGGGEPTIEWDLLITVTDYIRDRAAALGISYYIRLITNGTLLTPDRAAWLAANIQFVTLSFDILPELQQHRSYAGGRSTQEKLLEVCHMLCEAGVKFHLRTTITAQGAHKLTDMVRYAYNNTRAKSIRFEPLSEIGRAVDSNLNKPMQQVFVEEYKKAYYLGQQLGIDVSCKMTTNIQRRAARFCEAEFTVTPSGKVSACHRYSREEHIGYDLFAYGKIEGNDTHFDLDKLNRVRMIDVHHFDDCKTCIAKWNCASGCLSARVTKTGINESGPLCFLTRELLKFSIINELKNPTI